MIRHKWIIGMRNQLANLAMECDSAAAIEDSQLSSFEREHIQSYIRNVIDFIDDHLPKAK